MRKLFAIAALLLASTAAQASNNIRIRRTHHSHRSGPWNGFDTRGLRQHWEHWAANKTFGAAIRTATVRASRRRRKRRPNRRRPKQHPQPP